MPLYQWSTTPANNATAATAINWAEGQPPSSVNDSARQMMADVATWYQSGPEWLNYGLTPTYVSATQFTVTGNQTSTYAVGRRVKAFVTAGTIYGTVSSSVYSSLTTVTVAWDSGSLDSGVSEVDVGILSGSNRSLPNFTSLTVNEPANGQATVTVNAPSDTNGANIKLVGNGATTPNKTIRVWSGLFQIANSAYNGIPLSLDDSGNLTVSGNFTANSDERLKKDWSLLRDGFIEKLAQVKSGTYSRTDIKQRQVGVSAQSLRSILPEAVQEDTGGILSVAYGQAALSACVELAKEVVRLRALVEGKK